MTREIMRKMFVSACCLLASAGVSARAQAIPEPGRGSLTVAVIYNQIEANVVAGENFWMQGGSAQLATRFRRHWGLAADVAGLHASSMHSSSVGLDLITATAGPRYTWISTRRVQVFGEGMAGSAFGLNSVFPSRRTTAASAHSLAVQVGGGVDLPLSRRVVVRPIEAHWLRTELPNATTNVQNNLRLGAGVVVQFR